MAEEQAMDKSAPDVTTDSSTVTAEGQGVKETVDVSEDDIKEFSESQKVPYSRFKDVNSKYKSVEAKLKELEQNKEADIRRAVEDAEARLAYKYQNQSETSLEEEYDIDGTGALKKEIASLQKQLRQVEDQTSDFRLKAELKSLEERYPEADTLSVLGWHKHQPNTSLEELMELSHDRNLSRVESKMRSILEQKKAKAKQAIATGPSPFKLDPDKKPKDMAEARRMATAWLKNR